MQLAQQFLPLLHSKREAARIIGISLRTIHSLIGKKQLGTVRIGRRVLVPHAELVRFCDINHTTSPTPRAATKGTRKRTRKQLVPSSLVADDQPCSCALVHQGR
jgi:excisionase family DNA binding protein